MGGTAGFKTGNTGPTGEQTALANYNFGENLVANADAFSRGTGMSTMHTQADVGAQANRAYDIGRMSIANSQAQTQAGNQLKGQAGSNIGALGGLIGGLK
jgi:hypothetical protein